MSTESSGTTSTGRPKADEKTIVIENMVKYARMELSLLEICDRVSKAFPSLMPKTLERLLEWGRSAQAKAKSPISDAQALQVVNDHLQLLHDDVKEAAKELAKQQPILVAKVNQIQARLTQPKTVTLAEILTEVQNN